MHNKKFYLNLHLIYLSKRILLFLKFFLLKKNLIFFQVQSLGFLYPTRFLDKNVFVFLQLLLKG